MASISEVAKTFGNSEPADDPRRALLSRLAASASFAKAPRLRELLVYLAESAFKARHASLTEQQVGVAVFNRPPGYDTSADTIVRVQASEIRKRLKYYFAGEGLGEPIIMDLPRGSYLPVFYYRREDAIEGVRTEVTPVSDHQVKTGSIETAAPRQLERIIPMEEANRAARARSALVPWLVALLVSSVLMCVWLAYQNLQLRRPETSAPLGNHRVNMLAGQCLTSTAGRRWTNIAFPIQTRIFTASFDAIPGAAARVNDVVGISEGSQTAISKFPILVAFSETGYILARHGNNYTAVNAIRYTSGAWYHFRLVIDVPAHSYAVYVTPPGGTEVTVGTNYGFRSEASGVKSLNSIGSQVDSDSGAITVCNFSIN